MRREIRGTTKEESLHGSLEQRPLPFRTDVAFVQIKLDNLRPSRTNPRGKHEREALAELTASVAKQGVLMPVLVRPLSGEAYELVAGHRRFAAAKAAGLGTIPATVRELSDVEVLEIQVVENLQREGLTPLEEAEGYQRLLRAPGYDVERIAERVGRSPKYVYDRMKLLALSKDAQALLLEEKITAGHAILLARLSPADQKRALAEGALLQREHLLFDPQGGGREGGALKAVSVRELAGWIDKHVRFDAGRVDPMLFPETAAAVAEAPKVVAITHLHYIPEPARDGKTVGPKSWARADGREKSKTCAHATLGFVAVGPHRGEAFEVCIAKDRCKVHWPEQVRAKARAAEARAAAPVAAKPGAKAESPEKAARKAALEKALAAAHGEAVEKADRAVLEAAAAMKPEAFVRALAHVHRHDMAAFARESGEKLASDVDWKRWIASAPLPQVQRALAHAQVEYDSEDAWEAFGVDAGSLIDEAEKAVHEAFRVQTSAKAAPAKKPAKPRRAKG